MIDSMRNDRYVVLSVIYDSNVIQQYAWLPLRCCRVDSDVTYRTRELEICSSLLALAASLTPPQLILS